MLSRFKAEFEKIKGSKYDRRDYGRKLVKVGASASQLKEIGFTETEIKLALKEGR